jgi:hypothetical protein
LRGRVARNLICMSEHPGTWPEETGRMLRISLDHGLHCQWSNFRQPFILSLQNLIKIYINFMLNVINLLLKLVQSCFILS